MRAALCCLLAIASPAIADDSTKSLDKVDTSKVEALFAEGSKLYDTGQWDAAITAFREAYRLMPDPSILFNIGQAYRQKGRCRDATAAYKAYLRNASDDNRARVEQLIKELEPCVKIEEENARRLLPPPPAPPPLPAGPTWPRTLRWSGYAAGGLGVALVGAGVLFSLRASKASADFERACADGCAAGGELELIEQRGKDADRNATIFYVAGAASLAIGATLAVIGYRSGERLVVQPAKGGAVATAAWRW